jgi:hypothetical protein
MPASYSGISNVSTGDVASASNINQYKESLEGARDFVPVLWTTAGNNTIIRMGDAAGANFFDVQDYAGTSRFKIDSLGNVTGADIKTIRTVRVTADNTANNTATFANVTNMSIALAANDVWMLDMVLIGESPTAADIRYAWTFPVDCTMRWGNRGSAQDNAGLDPSGGAMPTTYNLDGPITWQPSFSGHAAAVPISMYGLVTNGANAGTLQLQFSQLVATVADTHVRAGTFMNATKVSS